ncbi:MAG: ABC transporter ATP-binding protein [Bdellovibrionaceae bacterium]|nr:ABC transporter ATP-binding protein [Pseudobdellovibrionaceae bacterium]
MKSNKKPILSSIRRFPRPFALGILTLAFTNLFDVLSPFALKKAIDAISGGDRGALRDAVLMYAVFIVLTVSFRHQWRIHFGRFHHSVAEDLRNRLFNKLSVLGPRFFEKNPTGELMSLMINDVNTFRMAVGPALLILFDAGFIIAFVLPFMLSISVEWTWKTMILLPVIPFIIRFMEDRIASASRQQQDRLAEMSGFSQELVTGIRVVKGFAQESNRQKTFRLFSNKYAESCNAVARYDALFEPALQIGIATGSVILLAWGSQDVLSGAVTLGTFVAFHEYIKRMIWPMAAIGSGLSLIQQGRSSYSRIADVLDADPEVEDLPGTTQTIESVDALEVRNLTYTYPDATQPALLDVSFHLKRGEILGVIGPVGSGKSTLVQLLGRLRQAPANSILVNGQPLESIRLESWREQLAMVPQEAFLFSRTVEENLLFGSEHDAVVDKAADVKPVHRLAIDTAAQVAIQAEIEKLPLGYRSWLGEKGVNLSGGQRQRMTIARALARSGCLMMLDDSLSAVDAGTESRILQSLRQSPMTAIIVSHRLQALGLADRIMVLNEGRVEAIGTHDELLVLSPTYRRIHDRQMSEQAPVETPQSTSPSTIIPTEVLRDGV